MRGSVPLVTWMLLSRSQKASATLVTIPVQFSYWLSEIILAVAEKNVNSKGDVYLRTRLRWTPVVSPARVRARWLQVICRKYRLRRELRREVSRFYQGKNTLK